MLSRCKVFINQYLFANTTHELCNYYTHIEKSAMCKIYRASLMCAQNSIQLIHLKTKYCINHDSM